MAFWVFLFWILSKLPPGEGFILNGLKNQPTACIATTACVIITTDIVGFDNDKPSVFDKLINLIQDSGVVTAMVGLLNAPRGTKLYKKLMSENRLTKPPTGDNMDCTMNFIPKMDIHELLGGYQKVLNTIYSQKHYCKRIKTFLENYNFSNKTRLNMRYSNIKAFFRSMWRIGVIEKGRIYYWMLMLWSLKSPRRLLMAVRLSIYGFHFRKMLEQVNSQMKELATISSDEYNFIDNGYRFLQRHTRELLLNNHVLRST
jgi:hypothetical protein